MNAEPHAWQEGTGWTGGSGTGKVGPALSGGTERSNSGGCKCQRSFIVCCSLKLSTMFAEGDENIQLRVLQVIVVKCEFPLKRPIVVAGYMSKLPWKRLVRSGTPAFVSDTGVC